MCSWRRRAVALLTTAVLGTPSHAEIALQDAAGAWVRLAQPAGRIVSLAPHATELLFAAGAGERVVAVVQYSDFPSAARLLPRVGSGLNPDVEQIVALRPDLIVGWQSGNSGPAVARLRDLGLPVYLTEPRRLDDIAREIERLGQLAGTTDSAQSASSAFHARLAELRQRHAGEMNQRVFYQLLDPTLLTVNDDHLISDVLHLCSAVNVFGAMNSLVQRVEIESVFALDPDVIVAGGPPVLWEGWRARWQGMPALRAVQAGQLHRVDADLLHRQTPRVLDGAVQLCDAIDNARRSGATTLRTGRLR